LYIADSKLGHDLLEKSIEMARRGFARRVTSLLVGSRFVSTVLENHAMQEEQVDAPTKLQGPDVSKVYTETRIINLAAGRGMVSSPDPVHVWLPMV